MPERKNTKRDRCIAAVERRGGAVDPWAVCTAQGERRYVIQVREPKSRTRRAQRIGWLSTDKRRVVTKADEAHQFHRKADAKKERIKVARALPVGWRATVEEVRLANPVRRRRSEYSRAARRYEAFSGHRAQVVGRVKLPRDAVALGVGPVDFIGYTTVRDGKREKYMHKFKRASRPVLAASADGKRLFLLGGSFTFTDRGIEDE